MEDLEGEDETELEAEMEHLITLAGEFYDKEMEAYNSKSTAAKVIERQLLNENSKPVKDKK